MLNNLEMFISIPLDVSDYIWVCTFIRYFRAFGKSWLGGGRKGLVLVVNENGEESLGPSVISLHSPLPSSSSPPTAPSACPYYWPFYLFFCKVV